MEAVLAASSFYLKHKFYRITPKVHKTNNIKWLISSSIGLKLRSQITFTTYLAELVSSGAVRGWWVLVAERCTVCGHFSASSDRWTHLRRCGLAGTRYSFRPETRMLVRLADLVFYMFSSLHFGFKSLIKSPFTAFAVKSQCGKMAGWGKYKK